MRRKNEWSTQDMHLHATKSIYFFGFKMCQKSFAGRACTNCAIGLKHWHDCGLKRSTVIPKFRELPLNGECEKKRKEEKQKSSSVVCSKK